MLKCSLNKIFDGFQIRVKNMIYTYKRLYILPSLRLVQMYSIDKRYSRDDNVTKVRVFPLEMAVCMLTVGVQ